MKREDAVTINAAGASVTTGAASARIAIPNTASGTRPYYIRVAAATESFVKLGDNTVVATNNDILIQPADSLILVVGANTNIAYIQGASTGRVNITPLEDS